MSWSDLVRTLATVAITLVVAYAAARWRERADDRSWRRQQRLDAYRELLVEVDRVIELATEAFAAHRQDGKGLTERLQELVRSGHSLDRAATQVGLVGPPELAKLAHEMVKVAFEDVWPTSAGLSAESATALDWETATDRLIDQYQSFRAHARVDLGTDRTIQIIPPARGAGAKARLLAQMPEEGGRTN